jgi:hypothetical protein
VAYFFDYRMEQTVADEAHAATAAWVEQWQRRYASERPDTLCYRRTGEALFVDDTRAGFPAGTHTYYGPLACAYEHCSETMRTAPQVAERLADYPVGDVQQALDDFCRHGLMLHEDGRYLALALPTNPNW